MSPCRRQQCDPASFFQFRSRRHRHPVTSSFFHISPDAVMNNFEDRRPEWKSPKNLSAIASPQDETLKASRPNMEFRARHRLTRLSGTTDRSSQVNGSASSRYAAATCTQIWQSACTHSDGYKSPCETQRSTYSASQWERRCVLVMRTCAVTCSTCCGRPGAGAQNPPTLAVMWVRTSPGTGEHKI